MATNRQNLKLILLLFISLCSIPPMLRASDEDVAHYLLRKGDINAAIVEYREIIEEEIEDRNQKHGVDPVLLAEYGYAFALTNVYDVALITLDEALVTAKSLGRIRKVKEVNFYIAEVLRLMEYDNLAVSFQRESNEPDWITGSEIETLRKKHKTAPIINREDFKTTLSRISKLMDEKAYIQALVLSEELTFFYGQQPLSRLTAAEIWNKLGFFKQSLNYYTEAKKMTNDVEMAKNIDRNIEELEKKSGSGFAYWKYKYDPQLMVYGGGTFSLTGASVSMRAGVHTNFQLSTSLNFSYSHNYEEYSNAFYIGLSAYKRFFNLLAVGLGLNQSFGGGNYNIYVAPTVGLSFYKPRAKTSLDLFFNINVPCMNEVEPQFNLSFGVTSYF